MLTLLAAQAPSSSSSQINSLCTSHSRTNSPPITSSTFPFSAPFITDQVPPLSCNSFSHPHLRLTQSSDAFSPSFIPDSWTGQRLRPADIPANPSALATDPSSAPTYGLEQPTAPLPLPHVSPYPYPTLAHSQSYYSAHPPLHHALQPAPSANSTFSHELGEQGPTQARPVYSSHPLELMENDGSGVRRQSGRGETSAVSAGEVSDVGGEQEGLRWQE